MKVIIDRFEGDFAVCEKTDRSMMNIRRSRLPPDAKEGDVLLIKGAMITVDARETAARRSRAEKLRKEISFDKSGVEADSRLDRE